MPSISAPEMRTDAPLTHDERPATNGAPSQQMSSEDTVKMTWRMHRAKSQTGGGATCEFVADTGQTVVMTIRGMTSTKALAHLGAMEKVLNGAMVLDGGDLKTIYASLKQSALTDAAAEQVAA